MARAVALLVALAGALLWAILAIVPPAARGLDAPATAFSSARAMRDVSAIGRVPHPTGSAENERVSAYLLLRMHAMGAAVDVQQMPLGAASLRRLGKWSGRTERGVIARNLIGVFPGRDRSLPPLLLMAHHDSVWGSPGAADDAMGVAAALEVARAIGERGPPERDLVLLFTDGEELGLDGAEYFFARHPLARRVGAIINMEARGAGGRANMFETGPGNGAMMRLYAEHVRRPATNSLSVLVYNNMPNYTDYTVAKRRGIPGYNLAVLDRGSAYHSPSALPEVVDPASLQDMGSQALALSSALLYARDLPARTDDASFSDLMGRATIVYPAAGGWLILLGAALLIGFALWRERPGRTAIGRGTLITLAILLHAALLLLAFNALSGSGGANYYDRLAALPRLEAMAAATLAALLCLLPAIRRTDPHPLALGPGMVLMWVGLLTGGPIAIVPVALLAMASAWFLPSDRTAQAEGAILLLLLAGILVQATLPTAAPLLHWPLLLAAVAMAARAWLGERAALPAMALCAAIGVGHLLAQAHFLFLGIGAELSVVLVAPLFAALPLLLMLWPAKATRLGAALLLGVALMLALWVRFDPVAPTIPTYSLAEGGKKTKD